MPHRFRSPRAEPAAPEPVGAEDVMGRRGGWIAAGSSLIALVLVVVGAARAIADGRPVALVVVTAAVFAGWYLAGLALTRHLADRVVGGVWLVGVAVLWVVTVAVSPDFVWVAFALWLLAGFMLPMGVGVPAGVVVLLVVLAAPVAHTGTTSPANVIGPTVGGLFAYAIARGYLVLVREERERRVLIASLISAQDEMAQLQDELARTQRESGAHDERVRISRDIHDTIAQGMSSIGLLAHRAADDDGAGQRRALTQIEGLARDGLTDARRIVDALVPAELEGTALADALERMLRRLHEETGIRTRLHVDAELPPLPVATEVALLRVAQSALANVRLHAGANQVVVSLTGVGASIRLDVVDDGRGFDTTRWNQRAARVGGGGYGLRAMRMRMRELGGGLDVEGAPGEGVALSAHLPAHSTGDRAPSERDGTRP